MFRRDAKETCDELKYEIEKIFSFLHAHMPEKADWGTAGQLGYMREQLVEVARLAANLETTEAVEDLLAGYED